MELTIKRQVEETVNIEFPHYTKGICAVYWFKSENECICVSIEKDNIGIEVKSCYPKNWLVEDEVITADEFNLIFKSTLDILNKIK